MLLPQRSPARSGLDYWLDSAENGKQFVLAAMAGAGQVNFLVLSDGVDRGLPLSIFINSLAFSAGRTGAPDRPG
jgi:hypothetical protein